MYTYQINVAHNGKHVFRTDWIQIKEDAENAYKHLSEAFSSEEYSVTITARPNTYYGMQVLNGKIVL